jgi:hypothetical protein
LYGQSKFLLDIKKSRTIQESFDIATKFEAKVLSSKEEQLIVLEVNINEAIQDPIPPSQKEKDEVSHFPFHVFDDTLLYDSEGEVERESLYELDAPSDEDEALVLAPSFDKVIQIFEAPAHEEVNMVNGFPFQDFDDALFYDFESKEALEEPLDTLTP